MSPITFTDSLTVLIYFTLEWDKDIWNLSLLDIQFRNRFIRNTSKFKFIFNEVPVPIRGFISNQIIDEYTIYEEKKANFQVKTNCKTWYNFFVSFQIVHLYSLSLLESTGFHHT